MERVREKRFQWAPQTWWALGQWPIWPIGKSGAASAPSFKNLAGKLSHPVALLAVSPFNRFSISSSLTVEK